MNDTSATLDTVIELCRDRHCRIVLTVLAEERRSLTVRDLTQFIVQHEHHTLLSEAPAEVVQEIQISLHHRYLPKLEANGVIEYDSERQVVELTDEFDQLQPTIETIVAADPELDSPIGV